MRRRVTHRSVIAAAFDRAERLAAALAALGLRRGDVVSVQLPSTPEFVIIYYAVARLGAVLSTLHVALPAPREAEPILRHARARAFFAAQLAKNPIRPACSLRCATPAKPRHIISVGPARPGIHSLDTLIAGADRAAIAAAAGRN